MIGKIIDWMTGAVQSGLGTSRDNYRTIALLCDTTKRTQQIETDFNPTLLSKNGQSTDNLVISLLGLITGIISRLYVDAMYISNISPSYVSYKTYPDQFDSQKYHLSFELWGWGWLSHKICFRHKTGTWLASATERYVRLKYHNSVQKQ